jgi:hypothetical protein
METLTLQSSRTAAKRRITRYDRDARVSKQDELTSLLSLAQSIRKAAPEYHFRREACYE